MERDLRDPKLLGEMLMILSSDAKLRFAYDRYVEHLDRVPDYSANPGCIEKYGRPQDLPEG